MSDLPKSVHIYEQGPREGFQFEKGVIPTARKIELVDALSRTGIEADPGRARSCPQERARHGRCREVGGGLQAPTGRALQALSLNEKGLERAIASGRFDTTGIISLTASEEFVKAQPEKDVQENYDAQHGMIEMYKRHNVPGRARLHHGGVRLQLRRRHLDRARR